MVHKCGFFLILVAAFFYGARYINVRLSLAPRACVFPPSLARWLAGNGSLAGARAGPCFLQEHLHDIMKEEELDGACILVLANKQDSPHALKCEEVAKGTPEEKISHPVFSKCLFFPAA